MMLGGCGSNMYEILAYVNVWKTSSVQWLIGCMFGSSDTLTTSSEKMRIICSGSLG